MKREIDNKFFDLISFFISLFFTIWRSVKALFSKKTEIKKSILMKNIDFFARVWPKYFYDKPNLYKLTSVVSKYINYIFYDKSKSNLDSNIQNNENK